MRGVLLAVCGPTDNSNLMKPETRQIGQLLHGERAPVEAQVWGPLALHPAPWKAGAKDDKYTITHISTGMVVRNVRTQREGKGIIEELLALEGIEWEALDNEALRLIHTTVHPVAQKQVRQANTSNIVLVPLYGPPARSLDSPTLRASARRTTRVATDSFARGDYQSLVDAVGASLVDEWRELIMVRMASGKHQVIMPQDVPERPVSVGGYELGLPATKRSFKALWELGTQIDAHASLMLHNSGDDPLGENKERWEKWEKRLSELIYEGWMKWSICSSQFITLTTTEQEPFVKWLGFLGSEKKGWHALGAKTFLRSEKLKELLPIRRRIRQGIDEW